MGAAWDTALTADRPVLIEAIVDPATPLLPPRQPYEKAEKMYAGLALEGPTGAHVRDRLLRERRLEGFHDPAQPNR